MNGSTRVAAPAATALLASVVLALVACTDEPTELASGEPIAPTTTPAATAQSAREVVYPLAAFRSEHADRVEFSAGQWPHLIELAGKLERTIVVKSDAFIEYDVAEFAGVRLVGGLATKGKRHPLRAQDVTFRGELTGAGESELLLERTLSLGAHESFDLPIPAEVPAGGRLALRVGFGDTKHVQALWVDPFLRKRLDGTPTNPAVRPNVLVITFDTTRQDELSV
jgi:hypothetical protein